MTYPKTVVTVTIASYEDDGAQYTLVYPDGRQVLLGDAEDNYAELAGIIDDEYDKDGKTPPKKNEWMVIRAAAVAYLVGADDFTQEQLKRLADALGYDHDDVEAIRQDVGCSCGDHDRHES